MSRRAWQLLAAGAVLYLVVLVMTLPAAMVLPRLLAGTPVAAGGVEGTLWRGSAATLVVAEVPAYGLRWRIEPLALFRGRLQGRAEARLDEGFIRARLGYALFSGRLHADDVEAAARLARLAAPAGFQGTDGNLSLQLEHMVLHQGWPVRLAGRLGVGALSIQELGRQPLGDFEAVFKLEAEDLVAELRDVAGLLDLEANLRLDRELRWALEGEVAPRGSAPPNLRDALTLLGPADDRGRRPFGLGGRL
ncbi:MAG: type II secretion system protein N [Gammaproteobacteria bacterium]|nr:type II secretion system protein N [Gammaproteobacteria bacterium]TVQ46050.1 MAG: type II secretion system protein N [Gammaproteobacteria bacterium]